MNKKTFKIIAAVAAVLVIAGISVGVSLKSRAQDDEPYYKAKVASKKSFSMNGNKLNYVEPDPNVIYLNPEYCANRDIYKDGNEYYYYFDPNNHNIRTISNKSSVRGVALSDQDEILDDAKKRLAEWYDIDEYMLPPDSLKWIHETDSFYRDQTISLYQIVNDDIELCMASFLYTDDGLFKVAWLHADSLISVGDIDRVISEKEALEAASRFIEDEYGDTAWKNIDNRPIVGDDCIYWEITCQKYIGGYVVAVDIMTGEAWLDGVLK